MDKMDKRTELLSSQDVRRMLGISRTKATEILRTEVPTYRIGKVVRVKRSDFEAFLTRCRQEPGARGTLSHLPGGTAHDATAEEKGWKL